MKYLLLIHSNPQTWGHPSFLLTKEGLALPEVQRKALADQLDDLLTELAKNGELVAAEPLEAPERTKVVRIRKGVRATTDGPYSEAKEQLAGVFIIDVESPERAEEVAARIPEAQFAGIEVRPISIFD